MKPYVLCVVLSIATSILAYIPSLYETNAQRLARGLPPLPPKFVRSPTATTVAKRQVSAVPLIFRGKLEVRSPPDNLVQGCVRNWETVGTISGTNFGGACLEVSMTVDISGQGPADIVSTNALFPDPFYVGAGSTVTQNNPILLPSLKNAVAFTNVERTYPESAPAVSPRNIFVESAIWSINPSTGKLSAQWVNPDGGKPSTQLAYNIRSNSLFFVGNITLWNENNNTPASLVDVYLVPL
ncbi:hypothetical protein BDQ17DRAFT_1423840 [Cyathus striatus]|nr:hypothetical protein BDQ17DRAFT_1423840 [Cyathus striatus]